MRASSYLPVLPSPLRGCSLSYSWRGHEKAAIVSSRCVPTYPQQETGSSSSSRAFLRVRKRFFPHSRIQWLRLVLNQSWERMAYRNEGLPHTTQRAGTGTTRVSASEDRGRASATTSDTPERQAAFTQQPCLTSARACTPFKRHSCKVEGESKSGSSHQDLSRKQGSSLEIWETV